MKYLGEKTMPPQRPRAACDRADREKNQKRVGQTALSIGEVGSPDAFLSASVTVEPPRVRRQRRDRR